MVLVGVGLVPVTLQNLALIVIFLFALKMLFLIIKPKAWYELAAKIYSNGVVSRIVMIVLAYFVLISLIYNGVTYTQIFAVTLFVMLLMGISFAVYSDEVLGLAKKMLKDRSFWNKAWLPVLIWVILSLLTLNEMYGFF